MRSTRPLVKVTLALALLLPAGLSAQAQSTRSNQNASAVDFESILLMLERGVDEQEIIKRLEGSPTHFTLSGQQIGQLKDAGASSRLIRTLQSRRSSAAIPSDVSNLALILDCSGSMSEKMLDGNTKMEAAKKVLMQLIKELPNGKRVTFIVYGHKVFGEDKQRGCQSVEVILPLRELTPDLKDQLVSAISGLQARGWTPLASSLRLAGEELKKARGISQVIVVTDGMETCSGNPAQEAAALKRQLNLPGGVDLIGFKVTDQEKEAVQKIVEEGRGKYYDTNNAREITARLKEAMQRAEEEAERKAQQLAEASKRKVDEAKDPLPGAGRISWDVSNLEDNAKHFQCLKRTVNGDEVIWLLEVKSDLAATFLKKLSSEAKYTGEFFIYPTSYIWARYTDADDVQILSNQGGLKSNTKEVNRGEKLRLTLKLPPEDVLKKTAKITIVLDRSKNGPQLPSQGR